MTAPPRTYRFGPLDRAGWVLGLGADQCVALALGVVAGGFLLDHGAPVPAVLAPVAVGAAYAFGVAGTVPVREVVAAALRFGSDSVRRRRVWFAELPLLGSSEEIGARQPSLPPFLAGLALLDVPAAGCGLVATTGLGVVADRSARTVSASLRVCGREFSLLERAEQERLVHLWGDALAGFCTERTAVTSLRVTEWAAPAGVAEHERYLAVAGAGAEGTDAHRSYSDLLATAGPAATAHETLVTVTVSSRRLRARSGDRRSAEERAVDELVDEIRLLASRLETAGLSVEAALSAADTAEVLRVRCDPSVLSRFEGRRRSLAALAGVVSRFNAGPLATRTGWSSLRADGSLHRSYWIAEWPRLEVGPNWLEPLLLHAGAVRTISIHYEPVPPTRALRRIDRDATRLAADEEQRARSGFRVGARHRRTEEAVLEREAELVAGYAEFQFAGFVTVSASAEDALADACAGYEQAAAQSGLELRALDGRQDLAFVCSLPVGRGLVPRRWS